jgi:hypothetical protein
MEIRVEATGMEEAMKAFDPRQVFIARTLWFDRGTKYVRSALQQRAPARLKRKVRILTDGLQPPRWARIYVKSPLAHLIEGGTGTRGGGGFKHSGRYFPRVTGQWGIMETMGLSRPEAFLVARAIFERGGTAPRPFIRPTWEATHSRVEQMAIEAVEEAFRA